jgi:hypothetical protein
MTKISIPEGELPLISHIDGNMAGVEFIRRLHAGGLELRNADDNTYAVIVRGEPASTSAEGTASAEIQSIRVQLFESSGIVHAVKTALDCSDHIEIDEVQLASALEVARRMIDAAASRLEGVDHE